LSSKLPKFLPPSPYVPFIRRFTDERALELAETQRLYRTVTTRFQASTWAAPDIVRQVNGYVADLARQLAEADGAQMPPQSICEAMDRSQISILSLETALFRTAIINDWSVLSLKEQVDLRRFLRAQEHFLANEDRVFQLLTTTLVNISAGLIASLPVLSGGQSGLSVPLHTFLDVNDVVDRIIGTLSQLELYDAGLFATLNDRIYRNICAASNVVPYEDHKRPLVTAGGSPLRGQELIDTYLRDTPFLDLLRTPIPFVIARKVFTEHGAIFAPAGHGKTQVLQSIIAGFLNEPDPPAMFILDSQGDMLRKIEKLAVFSGRLADRLLVLDPEDPEPPALNFFQLGSRKGAYDAQLFELFHYLFTAIDSDLTAKQATAVTYLLRLMSAIPNATIETLKDVMEEDPTPQRGASSALAMSASKYADVIFSLDRITQDFFRNQFFNKSAMGSTRQQVARRLYTILGNPIFVKMFAAQENRFSALRAMRERKIVLINTSQRELGSEASAVFGRFVIAQCLAAAYERGVVSEDELAILIVDEASEYFDEKTQRILEQARKFGLGLLFATQFLEQMPQNVKAAVNGNTSIKLAGPVSYHDATALSREMYTTPDFLRSMRKTASTTQFACYVRGLTPSAIELTIPFGTLENMPRMTDTAHLAFRESNRKRYGAQPVPEPTAPTPTTATTSYTADHSGKSPLTARPANQGKSAKAQATRESTDDDPSRAVDK